jgi:dimethylargininase
MAETLAKHYDKLDRIEPPGTIDGGDVCQIENHFPDRDLGTAQMKKVHGSYPNISRRPDLLQSHVDIRGIDGLLHLKSGISYLGDNRILVTDSLAGEKQLEGFESVECTRRRRVCTRTAFA